MGDDFACESLTQMSAGKLGFHVCLIVQLLLLLRMAMLKYYKVYE